MKEREVAKKELKAALAKGSGKRRPKDRGQSDSSEFGGSGSTLNSSGGKLSGSNSYMDLSDSGIKAKISNLKS